MTTTIRLVKAVSEAGDVVVCPPDGIAETVLELGGETTRTERDSLYALQAAVVAALAAVAPERSPPK